MDWAALVDDLDARLVAQSVLLDQARNVETVALTVYALLGIDTVAVTRDGHVARLGPASVGFSAVLPEGGLITHALHPDSHAAFAAVCRAVQDDAAPRRVALQLLAAPSGAEAVRWQPVTVVVAPQWSEVEATVDGFLLVVLPPVLAVPNPLLLAEGAAATGQPVVLPATRAAVLPPRVGAPVVTVETVAEVPRVAPAS